MSFSFWIRIDSVRVNGIDELGVVGNVGEMVDELGAVGEVDAMFESKLLSTILESKLLSTILESKLLSSFCLFCAAVTAVDVAAEVAAEVAAVDELPFAPPSLHGSLVDHGSIPLEFSDVPRSLEFIDVPKFTAFSSLFLVLRLSSSDA